MEAQRSQSEFNLDQIEIRPPTAADLPVLRRLFEEGCIEGQVPNNDTGADIENFTEAYLGPDNRSGFWIADYKGHPVGMVGVQQQDAHVAEIRRLRVDPGYRRLGIGSKLLETAITFCREQDYLKVVLDTRVERDAAIRLFEKFGFQHARTRDLNGRRVIDFYFDFYRDPDTHG